MDMYRYGKFGEFSDSRLEVHPIKRKQTTNLTAVYIFQTKPGPGKN